MHEGTYSHIYIQTDIADSRPRGLGADLVKILSKAQQKLRCPSPSLLVLVLKIPDLEYFSKFMIADLLSDCVVLCLKSKCPDLVKYHQLGNWYSCVIFSSYQHGYVNHSG